jgi:hypothetical protein
MNVILSHVPLKRKLQRKLFDWLASPPFGGRGGGTSDLFRSEILGKMDSNFAVKIHNNILTG